MANGNILINQKPIHSLKYVIKPKDIINIQLQSYLSKLRMSFYIKR